jgi:flavin-binding protein dodecin
VHDPHDLLARRQTLRDVLAERALLDAGDKVLDDGEVDVGLEEREADLARGTRDVLVREATAAAEVAERRLELVGKRVEHRPVSVARLFFRPSRRPAMSDVAKVVTIIGNSPESFAQAAQVAVREAAKTIRGISGADVVSMSCEVQGDQITMYRTTVNISFGVEREGEGS